MALYSLSTKTISRKAGRSAVAAAAYRSGAELVDERTGVVHDYTRRRGVEHVEIMALDGIAIADSAALWNAAEAAEKRRDARVAREVLVALPAELDAGQRTELAQAITRDLVERYGVAAELAIHAPDRDGDQRNHHAHILITTRRWNHDGPGAKSQLEMSNTQLKQAGLPKAADELTAMRERWARMQNIALERAGVGARVDHRSLEAQGIDRVPQIHQGNYATQMIRQGTPERSDRASLNLEIVAVNEARQSLIDAIERKACWARGADHRPLRDRAVATWREIAPVTPTALPYLPDDDTHASRALADEIALARQRPTLPPLDHAAIERQRLAHWFWGAAEREQQAQEHPQVAEQPKPTPERPHWFWGDVEAQPTERPQRAQERPQVAEQPEPQPESPQRSQGPPPAVQRIDTTRDRQAAQERAIAEKARQVDPAGEACRILLLPSINERGAAIRRAAAGREDFYDALCDALDDLGVLPLGQLTTAGEARRRQLIGNDPQADQIAPHTDQRDASGWEPPPDRDGPGLD